MFSYPYCCLSHLGDFPGRQSTACNGEQIHSKFSEAMEMRRDPYGAGGTAQRLLKLETHTQSSGWDQDWRNGFFSPWQSRHGTGWFSKLLLYTTKEESGPSIISLLNQNFKANGMYALLGYYPPHCSLGNNSARRKPFLIHLQVLTLQRIEEIETILYFPFQGLKNQLFYYRSGRITYSDQKNHYFLLMIVKCSLWLWL